MGWLKIALVASVLAFAACGDGDPSTTPDAGAACGFVPDAGGCTPGGGQCVRGNRYPPPEAFVIICDPSCGDHGGCRDCVADQECEVELGAGAVCARPCGVCCRPDAVDGGPGTCPTCL